MRLAFTIKDQKAEEALNLFCLNYGYEELIRSQDGLIPNPEPKEVFAEKALRELFIAPYKQKKAQEAVNKELATINQDL